MICNSFGIDDIHGFGVILCLSSNPYCKTAKNIKGHYSLVNQLERSATSIGANIHEANYAHGKPDFIAKLQIALKECYETEYWIELFVKSEILNRDVATNLYNQCGTIRRILIASINTAKEKAK
ncbi:MAG: four helix bundle protein [Oscillospiraceae bacterium]|nr:four helix bundle protein [Oscillospiraceae bacterium]